MAIHITAAIERWPVAGQFVIARGAKTHVDVLVVGVSDGTHFGIGEGTAIYYRDETAESCLGQVMTTVPQLETLAAHQAKDLIQTAMPAGAARNALDCALWDVMAKQAGMPLWQVIGLPEKPKPLCTAITISLGDNQTMAADAAKAAEAGYTLLKLKLTGEGDRARIAAVHNAAPHARLIVDANESWGGLDITAEAAAFAQLGVEMIEQPLPDGADGELEDMQSPLPLYADESCHEGADVQRLAKLYDGVNIKLDKAGGLTEALKIADAAEAQGMGIMLGCMLSTSLGIAPAFLLAQRAKWVDLDGPALLAEDRGDGFTFAGGMIRP
jgi:L-Ala-D/L-Glu epimerase